jgi:hypothetical protein
MSSRNGVTTYYNDGYIMHIADVETDEPYFLVDWYVNEVLQTTSLGDGSTTDATFCLPDPVSGSVRGETYTIKATAESWDGEETDSRSYTVTVYDPIIVSGTKTNTGVWGYSRLSRQYLSGTTIDIDCYVYASNSTDLVREGFYRFRHTVSGPGVNVSRLQEHIHEDPEEDDIAANGGTYGPYDSSSLSISIAGAESDQHYTSDAYVRLVVSGQKNGEHVEDHWKVEHRETFTRN